MRNNSENNHIIKLWGQDFVRAKYGLDEKEVVPFVSELISQRDELAQRQEHISSLLKLAERTVSEADNLADQLKKEATEQAQAKASAIISEAEQQSQKIIEAKTAEALVIAKKEAKAIKAEAQQQAKLLLEEKVKSVQAELKNIAQTLYQQLLSQLETFQRQVTTSEAEFEEALSQPLKQISQETMDQANSISVEVAEPIQTIDHPNAEEVEKEVAAYTENQKTVDSKLMAQLEIQPPIDITEIIQIMNYLDNLPEVETTELIPLADKPLIEVILHEPTALTEILMSLPQVSQAKEVKDRDAAATTGEIRGEGEIVKIEITLSENSVLDESKERLIDEVSDIMAL